MSGDWFREEADIRKKGIMNQENRLLNASQDIGTSTAITPQGGGMAVDDLRIVGVGKFSATLNQHSLSSLI